jgi:Fe-S cluster assembly protein SufD
LTHGDAPGTTLLAVSGAAPFLLDGSQALPDGVIVCGLADAWERFPSLVELELGCSANSKGNAFAALNTAFLRDGAFVYIPPGITIEAPIYVRFLVAASNENHSCVWHRRTLIVCGDGSKATVVEDYSGSPGSVYFTNAVSELAIGENARLDHFKVLQEGNEAFHVHALRVRQRHASSFASCSISSGAKWARNEVGVVLDGENCECTLNGLYVADGDRLIDNHTRIDHARPRCASHELYKGILSDRARGVFNGKIHVHPDAQKTDAKQNNHTLLLSDDAVIDAKPELEIYADDVKCTHGASIGQLDEEAIFYLRTRGIDREAARRLLVFAFANDIIGRISVDALRTRLGQELFPAPA